MPALDRTTLRRHATGLIALDAERSAGGYTLFARKPPTAMCS